MTPPRAVFLLLLITLLLALPSMSANAGEYDRPDAEKRHRSPPSPTEDPSKALEKAKDHLMEAMEALGKAGILTYDRHMPELRNKTGEALEKAQELLKSLEEQTRKELEGMREKHRLEKERRRRERSRPKIPNREKEEEEMPSI